MRYVPCHPYIDHLPTDGLIMRIAKNSVHLSPGSFFARGRVYTQHVHVSDFLDNQILLQYIDDLT